MNLVEPKISKKPVEHNPNKWMLSFADLLSLVLTFFVLIFAMAEPIQFTNEYENTNNSSIAFVIGKDDSKITLEKEVAIDNNYLQDVLTNKILNDEGMESFSTKIREGKLVIFGTNENLNDISIEALYNTIKDVEGEMRFVAKDLSTAKSVAYKFMAVGMKNHISYFANKDLQNKVEIIIYPKF